jgi:hypothetical protein
MLGFEFPSTILVFRKSDSGKKVIVLTSTSKSSSILSLHCFSMNEVVRYTPSWGIRADFSCCFSPLVRLVSPCSRFVSLGIPHYLSPRPQPRKYTAKILSQITSSNDISFEIHARPKDAAGGLSAYSATRNPQQTTGLYLMIRFFPSRRGH